MTPGDLSESIRTAARDWKVAEAASKDLARQLNAMRTVLKHGTAGHEKTCTCVACEALRVSGSPPAFFPRRRWEG